MPCVYPTGTTIYKPDQCESGYTILSGFTGATLIDMNGNVVKQWEFDPSVPNKSLCREDPLVQLSRKYPTPRCTGHIGYLTHIYRSLQNPRKKQ